jgi:hypothetical protein
MNVGKYPLPAGQSIIIKGSENKKNKKCEQIKKENEQRKKNRLAVGLVHEGLPQLGTEICYLYKHTGQARFTQA